MKTRIAAVALVAALTLAFMPALLAGEHEKAETTWTGWITDEACGVKNANKYGRGCALDCYKNGSRLVLYVKSDDKLYDLDKQEVAAKNLGHPVHVTGVMEDGKIKVSSISEAGKS